MNDKEVQQRLDMIDARKLTTDIRQKTGIAEKEYAILTNITYARSEMTAKEYKEFKSLDGKNDNLRDHMSRQEMLLTQLAEEVGMANVEQTGANDLYTIQQAMHTGAEVAKETRKSIKDKVGIDPVAESNRLTTRQKELRKKKKLGIF